MFAWLLIELLVLVPMSSRALCELAMLNEVDYLLIAKLVAIIYLEIRRDCVQSLVDSAGCW